MVAAGMLDNLEADRLLAATDPAGFAPTDRSLRRLSESESLYLDLVRSIAAFIVVLDHAPSLFLMPHLIRWGHQGVIVFFVLSGYVISHVADTRERSASVFLVSRFARIWSVLVPAMVLTLGCDTVGRRFGLHPDVYASVPFDHPIIRVLATLGFISESWVSIQPFSNGVAWSLSVEFWYYMLFAAWTYAPPGRIRLIALLATAILSGHKALLLLPVWLMGVALQRSELLRRWPAWADVGLWLGGLLFVASVLAMRAYDVPIEAMQRLVSPWIHEQLAQARVFWFDWIVGLAVAAHLLRARRVSAWLQMRAIARQVGWCASVSFAAYLFHQPLLFLCAAFLSRDQGRLAIALTLGAIAVLGPPVERRKHWWRHMLGTAVHPVGSALPFSPARR
jgi:peptidoglycan/LPS O-acetylase OafA/YrhL